MRKSLLVFLVLLIQGINSACCQDQQALLPRSRFVFGLSSPELLHIGYSLDITRKYQVGVTAGVGPSWGTAWPQFSWEQRFYTSAATEQKGHWFFRQGFNYFPLGEDLLLTFSLGRDSKWDANRGCWTFDFGISTFVFYNRQYEGSEPYYHFVPVIRIQRGLGFKRR